MLHCSVRIAAIHKQDPALSSSQLFNHLRPQKVTVTHGSIRHRLRRHVSEIGEPSGDVLSGQAHYRDRNRPPDALEGEINDADACLS